MNEVRLKCLNNNKLIIVPKGTTLLEAAKLFDVNLPNPIVGALANNCIRECSFEFYHPQTIKFIDVTDVDGMRIYTRSLFFVLYAAVKELYPEAKLRIEHSVSKGYFCELTNFDKELDIQTVFQIGKKMKEIIEADIPFIHIKDETENVIEVFDKCGFTDKKELIEHRGQYYTSYYKMGKHVGLFYGYLAASTGVLKVFDLNKYFKGMLLQVPKRSNPEEVAELILQKKMFEIFREHNQWNKILNVSNISDLNRQILKGDAEVLIQVSEALQEKKIAQIADQIATLKDMLKIVLISGPSSSGKTTFGKRLATQLIVSGIIPINISLDNYFVNRELTPLDENGEYDFEALDAIDLKLFNDQMVQLLEGNEIEIPTFSFENGERFYDGTKLKMEPGNILIIEGIHGLNPKLTEAINPDAKYKIYISALTSINIDDLTRIPTTDNRLLRRILRDYKYRGYSAQNTIARWESVRRGEDLHIFPYQEEADVMFNTALLYEFAVLKPFVEPILLEVQPNQPEFSEATRLLKFLSYFKPIISNNIPPTSILREFLGGSSFKY
ncbi:MAG: nucleoside kinase [Marinilabiliaceae bacterium]|nr:nucleoside kinase [Marinilabiliaceae bacterium]